MSQVSGVKEDVTETSDSSDDSDILEIEDEKSGESDADEEMMNWALRTLRRTQYLSDSESEDEEEKEKSPAPAHSAGTEAALTTQLPTTGNSSACPVPVAASPPAAPSTITVEEEPTRSTSAAAQNTEDCAEESASACPVSVSASSTVDRLAVTIKEEPPPSPSSAAQNTEDPLKDSALESTDKCDTGLPQTQCTTTPPSSADLDTFSQTVSEESIEDALASLQMEWVTLPTTAECIVSRSGVIRNKLSPTAVVHASAAIETESNANDCTVFNRVSVFSYQFASATSEEVSKSPLPEDNEGALQKKDETLRTKELRCSADAGVNVWEQFLASVPPPRFPTTWKVQPSTAEEKALFHIQEQQRFSNPKRAFTYWLHGYESVVGPVKQSFVAKHPSGREVVIADATYLCSLTLVSDAVARLPNGVGTLIDVLQLILDSQHAKMSQIPFIMVPKVARALSLLSCEDKPCLRYSARNRMCVYLHRGKSEEELESLYQVQPDASEASKFMASWSTNNVERFRWAESLLRADRLPVCSAQASAQPALPSPGNPVLPSNSGPQPVHADENGAEQTHSTKKFQVLSDSDGSALVAVPTDCVKETSAAASANGAVSSSNAIPVLSPPKTTHANGMLASSSPLPPPPPAPSLSLANTGLSSSPALLSSSLSNGVLSSSSSSSSATLASLLLSSSSSSKVAEAASAVQPKQQEQQSGAKVVTGNTLVKAQSALQNLPAILRTQRNLSSGLVKGAPSSSTAARSTSHDAATKDLNNGSCRNPLTDFAAANKPSSGLTNIAVEKTCKCAHADRTGGSIKCLICGLFRRALPGAPASSPAGRSIFHDAARRNFNSESNRNPLANFVAANKTGSETVRMSSENSFRSTYSAEGTSLPNFGFFPSAESAAVESYPVTAPFSIGAIPTAKEST